MKGLDEMRGALAEPAGGESELVGGESDLATSRRIARLRFCWRRFRRVREGDRPISWSPMGSLDERGALAEAL